MKMDKALNLSEHYHLMGQVKRFYQMIVKDVSIFKMPGSHELSLS